MAIAFNGNQPQTNNVISNQGPSMNGFNSALNMVKQQIPWWDDNARVHTERRLNDAGRQFQTMFRNMVGRDATPEELDSFYQNSAGNILISAPGTQTELRPEVTRDAIAQYVSDTGQQAAEQYASQQLQGQQAEATRLSDLFRQQGRDAISRTESSLMDFQQRLFERLRPNLLTSLQAQGLLNTGGMNEAFAGQAKDLSDAATSSLLDMGYQNEQAANQIAYGGQAAPYLFNQNLIQQRPDFLRSAGESAINRNYNTFLKNLDFQNQMYAMNNQPKASFLQTLGQSTAQGLGQNLTKWVAPNVKV